MSKNLKTSAEVVDKNRANFCEYFQVGDGQASQTSESDEAKKKLEELFKK